MTRMQSILASIPYSSSGDKASVTEYTLHISIYLIFCLKGQFTQSEVHTSKGRADCVVWTKNTIYVFEFKLNGTKEDTLLQIEDKSYSILYKADGRNIVKNRCWFRKRHNKHKRLDCCIM